MTEHVYGNCSKLSRSPLLEVIQNGNVWPISTIYKEYRANCCRCILIYTFDDSVRKVQISRMPTKKHNNDIIMTQMMKNIWEGN